MEFPRQPKPVLINISSSASQDAYAAATSLRRFLEGKYANVELRTNPDGCHYEIQCWPFAVND